jgi:hypothetical protein
MEIFLCSLVVIYALQKCGDSRARKRWMPAAGALIAIVLFFAIEPEARAVLLLADYLGVDLVLTMIVIFLRNHLVIAAALLFIPMLRWAYRWGPVPGFWPHPQVLKSSWTWSGYAVIYPAAVGTFGAICLKCLIQPWVA